MSERIEVTTIGETYEDALISAFSQTKKYLKEEEQLFRTEKKCIDIEPPPWYLSYSACRPTMGGVSVHCEFTFERYEEL